ncbi:HmuY family protein [Leptospira sp. GIMC2001]|uniref:HmuY family protein n=1 Tax=Leptospira sp. GIMC2001 TaxID=1513297 RepID=UPI00234A4404|nr:HmuY family protein [Leptospira sp. GIMC2001]WCL49118.1 HmuY family protein [Leptospira sp. GIMC2001]
MKLLFNTIIILLLIQCSFEQKQEEDDALVSLVALDILSTSSNQSGEDTALDKVTTTQESSNVFVSNVNASSTKNWVFISLQSGGTQVLSTGAWDIRIRRFLIGTNSGTSGSGSAGACDSGSVAFNSVSSLNCTIQVDSLQSQDGGGFADVNDSANPALFNWYSYNNTILTAKNNVYLIRGTNGTSVFKLQMMDYYSSSGTSGYPKFRWSRIN